MNSMREGRALPVFLPDFCNIRMVLAVVLISELLALLLELASPLTGRDFMSEFGLKSLFVLWAGLSGAALLCVLRGALTKLSDAWAGFAAFSVFQGATALVSWLAVDFLPEQGIAVMTLSPDDPTAFYLRTLGVSGIVTAVLLRYLYIQQQWKKQVKAEAETRLELLQSRMRPHFLFNSLNTIASLTREDPLLAEELVQDLAELLRASITINGSKLIPLSGEIAMARQYLNIERQRLGDRLSVEWRIGELPLDALLPPLSLQPLIENAVYHGVEPDPQGGGVVISGAREGGDIVLTVKNSLPSGSVSHRRGNRIAMENLAARFKNCFSGAGRVSIAANNGFYEVRLIFPYLNASP